MVKLFIKPLQGLRGRGAEPHIRKGFMKCILIEPTWTIAGFSESESLAGAPCYPPIGLAYVAAVLRENGIEVKIIDAKSLRLRHEEVYEIVERANPDIVGVTVFTRQIKSALKTCEEIKRRCPAVKIVVGGPNIHAEHEAVIKNDFCSVPQFWYEHRRRSVENVLEELEHISEMHKIGCVRFTDELLPLSKKWLSKFCKEMVEDTINLARSLNCDYTTFTVVTPFPGTLLYKYCWENKLLRTDNWAEYNYVHLTENGGIIKLEHITNEELMELFNSVHREFYCRHEIEKVGREILGLIKLEEEVLKGVKSLCASADIQKDVK